VATLGLAAFVSPDQLLRLPDFRAGEHAFALLWAAAERVRPEGRVVKVLERASSMFVGTVKRAQHFVTVCPDDPRFRRDVFVPVMESMEALDGQKVMVEITDWGSPTAGPTGRVSEVLGTPGDLGLDVLLIVKHNGLPTDFPPEVTAAAATRCLRRRSGAGSICGASRSSPSIPSARRISTTRCP
jgi:exoribonuclease R